jgi:hypothetical protein
MSELVAPRERECECCGRRDRWEDDPGNWLIDGPTGDPNCIHEWDINGSHNPFPE